MVFSIARCEIQFCAAQKLYRRRFGVAQKLYLRHFGAAPKSSPETIERVLKTSLYLNEKKVQLCAAPKSSRRRFEAAPKSSQIQFCAAQKWSLFLSEASLFLDLNIENKHKQE